MKQFNLFAGKALLAGVAAAAVLLQAPSFAGAAPGGPATEQVRNCEAGIAALDPDKATDCLDQRILEAFAAENPGRGIKLLAQANTIKNLSDSLSIAQATTTLRRALIPALEPGTPAAALGLAPEADKFLAWVKKYRPGKLVMAQEAVLKWSTLPPEQQSWLGKNGVTVPAWEAAPLGSVKYKLLAKYAEAEAAALLKTPAPADMAGVTALKASAMKIRGYLSDPSVETLYIFIRQMETLVRARKDAVALLPDAKQRQDFQAKLAAIRDLPVSDQLTALNALFDKTPALRDSEIGVKVNAYRTSSAVESIPESDFQQIGGLLQKAFMAELAGTAMGDRLLSRLDFSKPLISVQPMPGALGMFNPRTGLITVSKNAVEDWLKNNKFTVQDLKQNPAAIQGFARYISPVVVHEAVHKEQKLWKTRNGIPDMYNHEDEIETFTSEALFITEKSKKDPEFAAMLKRESVRSGYIQGEIEIAQLYASSPRELRRYVQDAYYDSMVPSLEYRASEFLTMGKVAAAELDRRKLLPAAEQARLERTGADQPQGAPFDKAVKTMKTSALEGLRDALLALYSVFRDRVESEAAWYASAFQAVKAAAAPAPASQNKAPPLPGEGKGN